MVLFPILEVKVHHRYRLASKSMLALWIILDHAGSQEQVAKLRPRVSVSKIAVYQNARTHRRFFVAAVKGPTTVKPMVLLASRAPELCESTVSLCNTLVMRHVALKRVHDRRKDKIFGLLLFRQLVIWHTAWVFFGVWVLDGPVLPALVKLAL